jgi:D-3-phosphoglycerate dehydrogenase / 2-oxoglutarate reductase
MKVIISEDYQDSIRTLDCYPALSEQFEVEIHHDTVTSLEAQAERFADADALLLVRERTPIGADLLARLPKLKYISQTGRAANHVDLAACTARGIPVSAEGAATTAAAELTWALVLASMRNVHLEATRLKNGLWQGHLGVGLKGRTLGIAGYGKIGSVVAGYGRAFGMRVIALGDHETSLAAAAADGIDTQPDRRRFFQRNGCRVLPSAAIGGDSGFDHPRRSFRDEADGALREHEPKRAHRARGARGGIEGGASGICGGRRLRA